MTRSSGTVDGMYEIADQVRRWLADGHDVRVAQVVATRGFSSRSPAAALAWTDTDSVGGLLPVLDAKLVGEVDGGLVDIDISDADAVGAGLSCGGVASVLVQPATAFGAETWARLAAREPLCLLTEVRGGSPSRTETYDPTTVHAAVHGPGAADVPRLFARGVTTTQLLTAGDERLAVVTLWPATTLVVVGDGSIASALADTGALLDWTVHVVPQAGADELGGLTESDAVLVLSHDRAVDGPALAAALAGRCGYVGALGSRRTQAARREWLTTAGVDGAAQSRIHGPAGLDIDAHTPVEIAISVVAEILASRSAASGGSLRDRHGPVHVAGVSAPPPRYTV